MLIRAAQFAVALLAAALIRAAQFGAARVALIASVGSASSCSCVC
ncbi:hypothetical protein [Streptomyces sp. NPDC001135]